MASKPTYEELWKRVQELEEAQFERKRAENALRESEALFRNLFEHHAAVKLIIDPDSGNILDANVTAAEFYGWTRAQLRQMRIQDINTLSPEEVKQEMERARAHERIHFEFRHRRADGSIQDVDVFSSKIEAKGKDLLYSIIHDITDRKQAEEALRKAHDELELRVRERTAELERRNQELQNFIFVASHDLQEPLRKIQTFGDIIASKCAASISEQGRDCLRRMRATAARMQALLRSLLQYSRLSSEVQPFARINLKEVVETVLSDLKVPVNEANASIEIGDLPEIEADVGQMAQVFQNLLTNALKFRREGEAPRVRVHCNWKQRSGSQAGDCEIYVEDNGIGFDEEYRDLIFKPFQRLHGREEHGGVGMGLAICKKVVERHGGSITARSMFGQGSTFIVTLPVKQN
jgi:two-component system sensor kinase FixL